jgi:hypothetical protein
MNLRRFCLCVFAIAVGLPGVAAGGPPAPTRPDDPEKAHQLREEALDRLLRSLIVSCHKMLGSQVAIHQGTTDLHQLIAGTPRKTPRLEDRQAARQLAAAARDVVLEADRVIALLEAEGSAVAFPEVFRELRKDMVRIVRLLQVCDVGAATQALEEDVIDTLREMTRALKKR